jgi:hypothetical protein
MTRGVNSSGLAHDDALEALGTDAMPPADAMLPADAQTMLTAVKITTQATAVKRVRLTQRATIAAQS